MLPGERSERNWAPTEWVPDHYTFYCGLGIPLAIRKNIGYAVPEGQPLYNFREYNGYTMGIAGKKD